MNPREYIEAVETDAHPDPRLDERHRRTELLVTARADDRRDVRIHLHLAAAIESLAGEYELDPDGYPDRHVGLVADLLRDHEWDDLCGTRDFPTALGLLVETEPSLVRETNIVSAVIDRFDLTPGGGLPDERAIAVGRSVARQFPEAFVRDREGRAFEGAIAVLEHFRDEGILFPTREGKLVDILLAVLESFPEDATEAIPVLVTLYAADGWRPPGAYEVSEATLRDEAAGAFAEWLFARTRERIGAVLFDVARKSPRARDHLSDQHDAVLATVREGDDAPGVASTALKLAVLLGIEEARDRAERATNSPHHTLRIAAVYARAAFDAGVNFESVADAWDTHDLPELLDRITGDDAVAIPAADVLCRGVRRDEYDLSREHLPVILEQIAGDGWDRAASLATAVRLSDVALDAPEQGGYVDGLDGAVRAAATSLVESRRPPLTAIRFLTWVAETAPELVEERLGTANVQPTGLLALGHTLEQRVALAELLSVLAKSSDVRGVVPRLEDVLAGSREAQRLGLEVWRATGCHSDPWGVIEVVEELVRTGDGPDVRRDAVRSLGSYLAQNDPPDGDRVDLLAAVATDGSEDPAVRVAAFEALSDVRTEFAALDVPADVVGATRRIVRADTGATREPSPRVRAAACSLLGVIGDDEDRSLLAELSEDPDCPDVVRAAAEAALER